MMRSKTKKLAKRAKASVVAEGKNLEVFPNKKEIHDESIDN